MEQYRPNLGELCDDKAMRDAVHIACAPVVVGKGQTLEPGERVGLIEGELVSENDSRKPKVIGVIDPFLKCCVREGQKVWLMLLPNTVTSLRHLWQHDAFRPKFPGV